MLATSRNSDGFCVLGTAPKVEVRCYSKYNTVRTVGKLVDLCWDFYTQQSARTPPWLHKSKTRTGYDSQQQLGSGCVFEQSLAECFRAPSLANAMLFGTPTKSNVLELQLSYYTATTVVLRLLVLLLLLLLYYLYCTTTCTVLLRVLPLLYYYVYCCTTVDTTSVSIYGCCVVEPSAMKISFFEKM